MKEKVVVVAERATAGLEDLVKKRKEKVWEIKEELEKLQVSLRKVEELAQRQ